MKNHLIIPSALIAISIVILGFALKSGIDSTTDSKRVVSVRGLCEKEVPANKVTWPIVTRENGNDLQEIYRRITATNEVITEFLTRNGIAASEISINPPSVNDNYTAYSDDSRIKSRYQVTNVVVVTTNNVALAQELMVRQTELMSKGIATISSYEYTTTYEYTDLNSIKPEMIAEATANARKAAEKFADDSHSRLGKIKDASQGQFSISDRDQFTPNIKTIRVVTYINYYLK